MPNDQHRLWAHRIVWAAWRAHVVQTSEHLTAGQSFTLLAPDYRAEQEAAELLEQFETDRRKAWEAALA